MEEASFFGQFLSRFFSTHLCKQKRVAAQKGQALIEYLLILSLALVFLRVVYFNKDFGFKASIDKTMLRVGALLEQNLKTGTQSSGEGKKSLEAFAGTDTWNN